MYISCTTWFTVFNWHWIWSNQAQKSRSFALWKVQFRLQSQLVLPPVLTWFWKSCHQVKIWFRKGFPCSHVFLQNLRLTHCKNLSTSKVDFPPKKNLVTFTSDSGKRNGTGVSLGLGSRFGVRRRGGWGRAKCSKVWRCCGNPHITHGGRVGSKVHEIRGQDSVPIHVWSGLAGEVSIFQLNLFEIIARTAKSVVPQYKSKEQQSQVSNKIEIPNLQHQSPWAVLQYRPRWGSWCGLDQSWQTYPCGDEARTWNFEWFGCITYTYIYIHIRIDMCMSLFIYIEYTDSYFGGCFKHHPGRDLRWLMMNPLW